MIQKSLGGAAHSQNKTIQCRHHLMDDTIVMLIKLIPNILLYFANFKKFEMQYLLYIIWHYGQQIILYLLILIILYLILIILYLLILILSPTTAFSIAVCFVRMCMHIRGCQRIISRNSFSSSTTWVPESNSDCQAWQQEPLPAEPP